MKFSTLSLLSLAASAAAFAPSDRAPRSMTALDMARRPFISGNWKLNPQTRDEATALAKDIAASITDKSPDSDVALFVPYVFIEAVKGAIGESQLSIGAEVRVLSPSAWLPFEKGFQSLSHVFRP
jgi:triosephosphate isomerase (TIM)